MLRQHSYSALISVICFIHFISDWDSDGFTYGPFQYQGGDTITGCGWVWSSLAFCLNPGGGHSLGLEGMVDRVAYGW